MSKKSPEERLAKALDVEEWLVYQLQQTRAAIPRLRAEVAEQERRRDVAYIESRFTIEPARTDDTLDRLHRGGCRKNATARDFYTPQDLASILGTRQVDACDVCNPLPGLRGVRMLDSDEGA